MNHITIALALFITLSAHTCNEGDTAVTSLLDKKWVFQSLNGKAVTIPDGVDAPWLQLAGDRLTGFGGCNNLMGDYKLGDGVISFPNLGSTKKYCEGLQPMENEIKQVLGAANGYELEGGQLKLMSGGKEVAVLK